MLYSLKSADGVFMINYKEKTIGNDYTDTLHNYDECKIVRVLAGHGIWKINDKSVPFEKDDVFIFSRLDFRKIVVQSQTAKIEQVNFLPASLGSFGGCTEIFFSRPDSFTNKITPANIKNEICSCFSLLRQYALEKEEPYQDDLIVNTLIRMALLTARAFGKSKADENVKGDAFVASVMQYVSDNLDSDLTLSSTAKHFGFSQTHFSQSFKKNAGISFCDYVATRRINNIILELNRTNENILDIALRFGFKSSSGFYKTFTRLTGTSPKKFRTQ